MKFQAVSEVTKSSGFKALEDELTEAIEATRRDWAKRFVFPVFNMNVNALRKRFQLSFCRLLSLAAKGFIAQVGIEGYDHTVAVMDLLAMHSDDVIAPLNVTIHGFLVLLKEAMGATIIPSPTVDHSLSEVIHKINGTSPSEDRGQEDENSTSTNAAHTMTVTAVTTINEQLTAAESAVTQATSHLELMRALLNQARTVADEATRCRTTAHETLATARRARAAAIDDIDIAAADESQCVAELNAADMDAAAVAKNKLAAGAQALYESATRAHVDATRALNTLRENTTNANAPSNNANPGGINRSTTTLRSTPLSVGSIRSTTTPRSMSSLSTTPTMATTTTRETQGAILPGNDFQRATSLLHRETTMAIHDIVVVATENTPRNVSNAATSQMNEGRTAVTNALKTLLDDGIVMPLRAFHTRIINSAQDRRIAKATVEPQLEQAATRIAAVVEAERPANRPTLKGLIHNDVNKTTDDLRRRIQSLEAKLGETKNALKRKSAPPKDTATIKKKRAKKAVGDDTKSNKSNKTMGDVVAPSAVIPYKNKTWKRETTKTPTTTPTKYSLDTPAGKDSASTTARKKSRKKASSRKSSGKGKGKPTAAHN